jgi:2-phosphosulfolactate phosphatase
MRIERLSLREGAQNARGTTVIIDVFRAFTCEPLMYHFGASKIMLEADIERCLQHRGHCLLVGEKHEKPIEGFDLINSPHLIMAKGRAFFQDKRVIHRSTSGVTGAVNALKQADEVLLASFVNARATANYIRHANPSHVSIVAMGILSSQPAPEDERCGDYIESLLNDKPYDHVAAIKEILAHETGQKFLRGDKVFLPPEDAAICIQRDIFDFALRAKQEGNFVVAHKITL